MTPPKRDKENFTQRDSNFLQTILNQIIQSYPELFDSNDQLKPEFQTRTYSTNRTECDCGGEGTPPEGCCCDESALNYNTLLSNDCADWFITTYFDVDYEGVWIDPATNDEANDGVNGCCYPQSNLV